MPQESHARKIDEFELRPEPSGKTSAAKKKRVNPIGWIAALFVVGYLIIGRYVAIYEGNNEVARLSKQYEQLMSDNKRLQMSIDSMIDLRKVEEVAVERLLMHKPDSFQIFYINWGKDDYGEKARPRSEFVNPVNSVPGVLSSAISAALSGE